MENRFSQAGTQFRNYLKHLSLDKNRAQEAQRIGAMPKEELEKSFAEAAARHPQHHLGPAAVGAALVVPAQILSPVHCAAVVLTASAIALAQVTP